MTKVNTPPAPVVRSSAGLRDAIFDEIDSLRNGTSNATRANAVAKLAGTIVETVRMELEVQKYATATASQIQTVGSSRGLPEALALGS
jgi:hypothetical protein